MSLAEINQKIERVQQLITLSNARLHELKAQKAQFGIAVPPHIATEIKQIEEELAKLREELQQLDQEKALLEAPKVHLYTFGTLAGVLSENVHLLDWGQEFDRRVTPRKIPGPEIWQEKLWIELTDLEKRLKGVASIHLQGTIALSAGFAFGHVFSQVGQYQVQVEQGPTLWRSDEHLQATEPNFTQREITGQQNAADIAVIVNALPGQDSDDLVAEVFGFMGEQGGLKKVLLFEAEQVTKKEQLLAGWEAAVLARSSRPRLRRFVKQNPAGALHIFLATPAGLAVFLGHYWNAIGITGQVYEWTGLSGQYAPSCRVKLN